MAVFAVGFIGIVSVVVGILFYRAPHDVSPKMLFLYAGVFFIAFSAIGFSEMWFAMMHNDIGLRKEIKRVEVLLLELREACCSTTRTKQDE